MVVGFCWRWKWVNYKVYQYDNYESLNASKCLGAFLKGFGAHLYRIKHLAEWPSSLRHLLHIRSSFFECGQKTTRRYFLAKKHLTHSLEGKLGGGGWAEQCLIMSSAEVRLVMGQDRSISFSNIDFFALLARKKIGRKFCRLVSTLRKLGQNPVMGRDAIWSPALLFLGTADRSHP